jgi:hypothetical protein
MIVLGMVSEKVKIYFEERTDYIFEEVSKCCDCSKLERLGVGRRIDIDAENVRLAEGFGRIVVPD